MKKLFTLIAAFAASVGIINAQTTITWDLTNESNQLEGVSSNPQITVSKVTVGSNITVNGVKSYAEGDITYKGTLFSPTTDTKENKTAKTDGTNLVSFKFTIPSGYAFKANNVSFYCAKDGSGNDHLADIDLIGTSTNITVKSRSEFGRGTQGSAPQSYTLSNDTQFQGDVTLQFNLYGKVTDATKGWVLGNVVVAGDLVDLSDTRTNAPISWNPESVTIKVRDKFNAPVLKNDENLTISYSSNNEALATVSEAGVISLVEGVTGSAVISATYDGSAEGAQYKTTTVNTTITVKTNIVDVYAWESYENDPKEIATDYIWTPSDNNSISPKSLVDDKFIEMHTVYTASGASKNYNKKYLGYDFQGGAQIGRVAAVPSEDVKDGGKNDGSSALIVTPKTDLQLVMFFRRQGVEQRYVDVDNEADNVITRTHYIGLSANDSKSVYASAHSDIAKKLDQTVVFGVEYDAASGNDYLTCAAIWDLKAGETYTLWAYQTTIATHGIGYILPSPEAPEISIEGAELSGDEIKIAEGETKSVTLKAKEESHSVYAKFIAKDAADEPAATADDDAATHESLQGVTFDLADENPIELSEEGTLHFYAYNPETGKKSELTSLAVTKDNSSAIANIAADANAAVEYFNLQGIRVDNPENGIFIRRQGNSVSKVVVK